MKKSNLFSDYKDPLVIGGVGGSGTRLIAECAHELGYFVGHDLNEPIDNLWITLLFKRLKILKATDDEFSELIEIFLKGMMGFGEFTIREVDLIRNAVSRPEHPMDWLWFMERAYSLLSKRTKLNPDVTWGWKEPNSHIILDRLVKYFKDMKYIHVVRNGLDMAHSSNQNQLRLWGQSFIGKNIEVTPYYSLHYWCIVHKRIQEIGKTMGQNFLFLNYDDFCLNPEGGIEILSEFLGVEKKDIPENKLLGLIKPPSSIGRFKEYGTDIFDKKDIEYVQELGFDIN